MKSTAPLPPAPCDIEVSIVMPCLNEKETVGACVAQAIAILREQGLRGEVIVADNGSTDGSIAIAEANGAHVVHQPERGYGAAYLAGIAAARGNYILIGDSDNSYNFGELPKLIAPLRAGSDLVVGSRFKGHMQSGAMPWPNRYLGNPILTGMLNLLFKLNISDAQSGMRAFTRAAYNRLHLQTPGMEFASEMLMKASLAGLKITDVPIDYYRRGGNSKLSPLSDAWRHIRFMLLFSPVHLFLLPGALSMLVGLFLTLALVRGPIWIGNFYIGIHYMIVGSLLAVLGLQMLSYGLSAKAYAYSEHLVEQDSWLNLFFRYFNLERGLLFGGLLAITGFIILVYIFIQWLAGDVRFNQLIHLHEAIAASTLTIIGMQIIASAFFLSLLELHKHDWRG